MHVQKKIPAGCPAGEGGMVEEIYIHYYRHLVQRKVTPFRKKNARNCSGENFPFRRYQVISRFELKSLVRKLLAMDIMAVFAAFLEISRRSLGRVEIVLLCSFHDIAGPLNIRFSKIHGVLSFLGLEKPGSLSE